MKEWILYVSQVVSQIVTTGVSVFGVWVAYQILLRTPEQSRAEALGQNNANGSDENKENQNELIVFHSNNQRTTLKVEENGLKCYLFDSRHGKTSGLQWVIFRNDAEEILKLNDINVYNGFRLKTGTFSIGNHRNWLYSKSLFPEPKLLEKKIHSLLELVLSDQLGSLSE